MPGQNFVALGSTSWYTSPASASPGLMVEPDGYCPRNARLSSGTSMLCDNIDVPLLNRALRGQYPSGSTIKPGLALAGLVYHDVEPNATKFCPGIWRLPGSSLAFREGRTGRHGAMDLRHAIAKSCDVYFYGLASDIGVDHIAEFLAPLGFGSLTGIDIGGEKPGLLPSKEWKRKTFKRPADQ